MNGQCVFNAQSPTGACLYGDDLASTTDVGSLFDLPQPLMTCGSVIQLLITHGYDPVWFCQNAQVTFGKTCCNTCAGNYSFEVNYLFENIKII